jgi:hypothetical protein
LKKKGATIAGRAFFTCGRLARSMHEQGDQDDDGQRNAEQQEQK